MEIDRTEYLENEARKLDLLEGIDFSRGKDTVEKSQADILNEVLSGDDDEEFNREAEKAYESVDTHKSVEGAEVDANNEESYSAEAEEESSMNKVEESYTENNLESEISTEEVEESISHTEEVEEPISHTEDDLTSSIIDSMVEVEIPMEENNNEDISKDSHEDASLTLMAMRSCGEVEDESFSKEIEETNHLSTLAMKEFQCGKPKEGTIEKEVEMEFYEADPSKEEWTDSIITGDQSSSTFVEESELPKEYKGFDIGPSSGPFKYPNVDSEDIEEVEVTEEVTENVEEAEVTEDVGATEVAEVVENTEPITLIGEKDYKDLSIEGEDKLSTKLVEGNVSKFSNIEGEVKLFKKLIEEKYILKLIIEEVLGVPFDQINDSDVRFVSIKSDSNMDKMVQGNVGVEYKDKLIIMLEHKGSNTYNMAARFLTSYADVIDRENGESLMSSTIVGLDQPIFVVFYTGVQRWKAKYTNLSSSYKVKDANNVPKLDLEYGIVRAYDCAGRYSTLFTSYIDWLTEISNVPENQTESEAKGLIVDMVRKYPKLAEFFDKFTNEELCSMVMADVETHKSVDAKYESGIESGISIGRREIIKDVCEVYKASYGGNASAGGFINVYGKILKSDAEIDFAKSLF